MTTTDKLIAALGQTWHYLHRDLNITRHTVTRSTPQTVWVVAHRHPDGKAFIAEKLRLSDHGQYFPTFEEARDAAIVIAKARLIGAAKASAAKAERDAEQLRHTAEVHRRKAMEVIHQSQLNRHRRVK